MFRVTPWGEGKLKVGNSLLRSRGSNFGSNKFKFGRYVGTVGYNVRFKLRQIEQVVYFSIIFS